MGTISPSKDHSHPSLTKKLLPWTFYAMLPLVLYRLYFYPYPLLHTNPIVINSSSSSSSFSLSPSALGTCMITLKILCFYVKILVCFGSGFLWCSLLQKRKVLMKLHVTTPMANGSMTRGALCTMVQLVVQSRKARIASSMAGQTWVISTGDGNQSNASSQGLNPTHFSNSLVTNI